jgi:hypothetical protein
MQYMTLEAALILTITVPQYISPPSYLLTAQMENAYSATMGFAAFNHAFVLVGCAIITAHLNSGVSSSDTMVIRVDLGGALAIFQLLNYLAIISTLVCNWMFEAYIFKCIMYRSVYV